MDSANENQELQNVKQAVAGNKLQRQWVSEQAHPLIERQTRLFCKRFCHNNYLQYRCTLFFNKSAKASNAPLCEWGNASYAWMLHDLTKSSRLEKFQGKNNARLVDYLFVIVNSLPFYERWKDWRFGRRDRAPTYIVKLSPNAGKVFLALRQGDQVANIAQRLVLSLEYTEELVAKIIIELTKRSRLHLLDPAKEISLSAMTANSESEDSAPIQADLESYDVLPELLQMGDKIKKAWAQLSSVEQFVLETMVVDEMDADDVLEGLKKLDVSIKPGISPDALNRQHLYYFRRKTLHKLAGLAGIDDV